VRELIADHRFTHEMVPTQWHGDPATWEALLPEMPLGALLRNLGRLTSLGLIKPLSSQLGGIVERFGNEDAIRKSRLHPLAILTALKIYRQGHGMKGSLRWDPVGQVVDALDGAFYTAFGNVRPTGKSTMLALDVSGSMGSMIAGSPLSCREASAAMAMVTARTESRYAFFGFSTMFVPLPITAKQRLDDVVKSISRLPFSGTDCALPMLHATRSGLEVDVFQVYTDSETWHGDTHPHQALRDYRNKSGRNAKLAVVGMTATEFTIADPTDAGMLDVVGFDTATPNVLADFAGS
jgi:60 kDa SS-A/Ro ribonucleoprotein